MAKAASNETIEFPAVVQPIAVFFAIAPLLTVGAIGLAIAKNKLPLVLIAMLIVLAVACITLAKDAISNLGQTSVELSPQELIVRRLIGSASYPWTQVEAIRLVDSGATFADAGRGEEKRAAIAVFLRKPDRKETPADEDADFIIVSRAGEEALKVAKACERIQAAKRGSGGKGGKLGATGGREKGFRRTAAA